MGLTYSLCILLNTLTTDNMPTPQNLPALIKEMGERAMSKYARYPRKGYNDIDLITIESKDLDTLITDTANATLEYVKGVTGDMHIYEMCEDQDTDLYEREVGYNQALENLIARLTSNPQ
jgi:hypothetical protein